MSRKNIFIILSVFTIVVIAIYVFLSIYITNMSIKATRKISTTTPISVGLDYFVDEFVTEDDVRLNGWFIQNKNLQTVIMVHGVDANKSEGYMLDLMKDIYDMGFSVFVFDLRAHGDSEGKNLGLGYIERKDLDASIKYVKSKYGVEEIILYGVSYGGTIVISNPEIDIAVKGIVADSPFYDLPEILTSEVASRTFIPEFLAKLLKFGIIKSVDVLYNIKTDDIISGIQSIRDFHNPVLLFHCELDDRIPISHSIRINDFLPENSQFVVYDNCEHAKGYEVHTDKFNKILNAYMVESLK